MKVQIHGFETYYLIADPHLNKKTPEINNNFTDILSKIAKIPNSCLIILGDFVDFWFENKIYDLSGEYEIFKEIKKIILENKYPVFLIKGNRDFLAGKKFEESTGIKVLGDECSISINGIKYYLAHGDIFCANDISYLLWRKFSRSVIIKIISTLIPKYAAIIIIRQFRHLSTLKNAAKKPINLSISLKTLCSHINDINPDKVVCGHNHILRIKPLSQSEFTTLSIKKRIKFMVLSKLQKWGGYYLRINKDGSEDIEIYSVKS
ncbi:metallophosphoesterase [Candidatus Dependentiae bacterium]|nr:metallophosphoesterase [Candidatus Dependentiae bacterium]